MCSRYSLLTMGLLGIAYRLIPQQPVHFAFGKELIDIHTHVAGIGAGDSGIVVSAALLEGYKFDIYLKAFGVTEEQLRAEGDKAVLHSLSQRVSQSKTVSKAVVLALDGVVENGVLNLDKTQLYVPNEFLMRELPNFPNLLFGASVNPYRADALQDRMLYGTDWPLQFFPLVSPWFQVGHVTNDRLKAIQAIKNQWDRDVALKLAMGVPERVFLRTRQLLKLD